MNGVGMRWMACLGVLGLVLCVSRSGFAQADVLQPVDYEVFQRYKGAADVPVRISGVWQPKATIEVVNDRGQVVMSREFEIRAGQLTGELLAVPEGGWYRLVLRVATTRRELTRFGVGDVFVVAGESNAAGSGNRFIPDRTGLVSMHRRNGTWKLADRRRRFDAAMDAGSPWPPMGELLAASDGVPVAFRNVAEGGTSTEQWLPESTSRPNDRYLYDDLQKALRDRRVRAVLWHQGETDTGQPAEKMRENMAQIIRQSRADAGYDVPWYVAFATDPNASPEARQETRSAQRDICRMGLALPGPDTDSYLPDAFRYDGVHCNGLGLGVHGLLWYQAVTVGGWPQAAAPGLDLGETGPLP